MAVGTETKPPTAGGRAGASTAGATFLAFLDVTVVNLAFPDLSGDFPRAQLVELAWVITAYAVAFAALLAPAGRVADVLGRRRMFTYGVAAFGLSSALAAAAPTLGALIAARAIQGASAAVMIPASLGLLLMHTPPERRAKAIGAWGAAGAFAAAVGPSLGGVLVDVAGWRSVFLINLPLVVLIVAAARRIPADGARDGSLPDGVGTTALAGGIALLVIAVSRGTDWGWTSGATIATAGGGLVLLVLALRLSATHPVPALEVRLWQDARFATTNAVNLVYGAVLFAWMLVGVLFLTSAWGYSELRAGFAMSPGALGATVAALAAGGMVDRHGQRAVAAAGALVMAAAGLTLLLVLPGEPAFVTVWLPAGLVSGAGIGLVATSLSSAASVTVPPQRFAAGLGLNMTARQFGGALGIAALTAYLQARAGSGLAAFQGAYGISGALAVVAAVLAIRLPSASAPASVPSRSTR